MCPDRRPGYGAGMGRETSLRRAAGRITGLFRRAASVVRRPPAPGVQSRPRADGRPDPGEVVWAWVPYDEGDGRGKDRPVLVVGRRGADLVGLMLSSQDHDRDAADEARYGRTWMDVGRGGWDPRGRPSEEGPSRLLLLPPCSTPRGGAGGGGG